VVKRYNIKSFSHRLRRIFKPVSRARRAWCNGHRLHFMRIATARPLALLEQRFGPLRGVAYLLLEDLGDLDLVDDVQKSGLSDARCDQVAELFSLLRTIEVSHGDTKASNFIINGEVVHLIDLDGMQSGLRRSESDRERFLANWANPERERFEAAFRRVGLL
jgi:hypothetical protein